MTPEEPLGVGKSRIPEIWLPRTSMVPAASVVEVVPVVPTPVPADPTIGEDVKVAMEDQNLGLKMITPQKSSIDTKNCHV